MVESSSPAVDLPSGTDARRADRFALPAVYAAVVAPFVIAAISLTRERWYPVLDMAMTELRVRDVGGTDTPLIGLPGRIGDFPDQGSHPGPLSFWLLAPFRWITAGRAYGLQLGSLVINAALSSYVIEMFRRAGREIGAAGRRGELVGALVGLAIVATVVRGYGFDLLAHPWNPYFPLLWWLAILIATWRVLDGAAWSAVFVVVAGTVVAQTHVPYLPLAVSMVGVCAIALVARARREGLDSVRMPLVVAGGLGVVLWLPPVVDQLVESPGNVSMLVDHFAADQPGRSIGLVSAAELMLRHLDAPSAIVQLIAGPEAFVELSMRPDGSIFGGLVTLTIWVVAAWFAFRAGRRSLRSAHLVLVVATLVGWFAMSRIFGAVWFYLTLWAWATTTLVVAAVAWTAVVWWSMRRAAAERMDPSERTDPSEPEAEHSVPKRSMGAVAVAAFAAVVAAGAVVAPFGQRPPDPELSQGLGIVLPNTITAIEAGVGPAPGPDATYVVFWQDATFIGAQGYGMVNELERAGFDVGVHPTWRVPVTPQRVLAPDEIDAEVHVVTGSYIEQWRADPEYVEVARGDPRSASEVAEYERLRASVASALADSTCPECVDILDVNLFGVVVTARERQLDADLIDDLERMVDLGQPISVFLTPPGNSF
ncbi:MAG: hypothetical protein AAGF91_14135 [Actinomycetota bacterium]